jgi:hypothetical protein
MSLPALYAQPTDDASWMAWAWNHQANHFDIVQAGTTYQKTSFTIAANATTLAGNKVMQFAAVPTTIKAGMSASDTTNPSAIAGGSLVTGFTSTLVEIGLGALANINTGDEILFGPGTNVLALTQYQLSPIDPNNLGMFFYQHQIMHNQINQVLGTTGYNLLDYDWSDPEQFSEWLNQNADEHQRICAALGIG